MDPGRLGSVLLLFTICALLPNYDKSGFAIVAPLSCFKHLDALKFTSTLAVFFVVSLRLLYYLRLLLLTHQCTL